MDTRKEKSDLMNWVSLMASGWILVKEGRKNLKEVLMESSSQRRHVATSHQWFRVNTAR